MYWLLLRNFITRNATILLLPVSATIGLIGYKVEQLISDRYTPTQESVKDKREKRQLEQESNADSILEHSFVPKTIFEKNLSPSLIEPDPRLKKYKAESKA